MLASGALCFQHGLYQGWEECGLSGPRRTVRKDVSVTGRIREHQPGPDPVMQRCSGRCGCRPFMRAAE